LDLVLRRIGFDGLRGGEVSYDLRLRRGDVLAGTHVDRHRSASDASGEFRRGRKRSGHRGHDPGTEARLMQGVFGGDTAPKHAPPRPREDRTSRIRLVSKAE